MSKEQLEAGLQRLGSGFAAEICSVCKGEGRYEQTYTIGCGMGSYQSMGKCDWCDGSGLRQESYPASESIVNQVMQAGKALQPST